MNLKTTFLLITFFTLSLGYCQSSSAHPTKNITVFVHGTLPPDIIRNNISLSKKLTFTKPGLCTLDEYPDWANYRCFVEHLCTKDPVTFQRENAYIFGWDGSLNMDIRKKSACDLIAALQHLKASENSQLTIITHSHGGNVALLMDHYADTSLHGLVDTLILLACPVQEQTKHLITSSLFKKISAFYSNHDMTQVLDPQGFGWKIDSLLLKKPFFSQRIFPDKKRVNHVLVQGSLKKVAVMHTSFLLEPFACVLPLLIKALDEQNLDVFDSKNDDIYTITIP